MKVDIGWLFTAISKSQIEDDSNIVKAILEQEGENQ